MRWQCEYVDGMGHRCEAEALYRLHFSTNHPFDHVDVCGMHVDFYRHFADIQDLHEGGQPYGLPRSE